VRLGRFGRCFGVCFCYVRDVRIFPFAVTLSGSGFIYIGRFSRCRLGIHVWCPVLLATNLSFLLVASVDRQCLRLSLGRWCTRLQFEECSGFIYIGRFSRCRYGAYLFCVCVCYVRRRLNIPDCGHHVWSWIFTRCFTVGRQHVGSGIREVLIGATVCP
jgi:hypothetical protein